MIYKRSFVTDQTQYNFYKLFERPCFKNVATVGRDSHRFVAAGPQVIPYISRIRLARDGQYRCWRVT